MNAPIIYFFNYRFQFQLRLNIIQSNLRKGVPVCTLRHEFEEHQNSKDVNFKSMITIIGRIFLSTLQTNVNV